MDESPTMLPSQVVAYRLFVARKARGWTQEQAAAELEPFLGERWSKASFSAAERSVDGKQGRMRDFSANDVAAFSRCFQLPIGWFYCPPIADPYGVFPKIEPAQDTTTPAVTADELVEMVLGHEDDMLDAIAAAWPLLSAQTQRRYERRVRDHFYPTGPQPPIDKQEEEE
jgi:hypothetical protein